MKKLIVYVFLVFAVVSICLKANAEELTATLGNIRGTAEVIRAGEQKAIPAKNGMTLNVGDIVKTSGESFAIVTFIPGTFIEVAGNSQLKVTKHEINDETSILNTRVDILSGHLSKAILRSLPPDALFEIVLADFLPPEAEAYHTPEGLAGISPAPWSSRDLAAEAKGLKATISNISGIVEIIKVGETQAILAKNGMALNVGDTLLTGRDSFATVTFLPKAFIEASGNSEVKIIRHGLDKETGALDTRVDVLSGHLSKAIAKNLPPAANFEIVLVDYIPLVAEPLPPETITAYDLAPAHSD